MEGDVGGGGMWRAQGGNSASAFAFAFVLAFTRAAVLAYAIAISIAMELALARTGEWRKLALQLPFHGAIIVCPIGIAVENF